MFEIPLAPIGKVDCLVLDQSRVCTGLPPSVLQMQARNAFFCRSGSFDPPAGENTQSSSPACVLGVSARKIRMGLEPVGLAASSR